MTIVRRLVDTEPALARATFRLIAEVFEDDYERHDDDMLRAMLRDARFWAFAALEGDEVVGGLTAHVLPMTRAATNELFIYDLAVRPDRQRQGVGRDLVNASIAAAAAVGIAMVFVAAENEDDHALALYRALGGEPGAATFFEFGAN